MVVRVVQHLLAYVILRHLNPRVSTKLLKLLRYRSLNSVRLMKLELEPWSWTYVSFPINPGPEPEALTETPNLSPKSYTPIP